MSLTLCWISCRQNTVIEPNPQPQDSTLPAYWPTNGWRESTPTASGMDSLTLEDLTAQIQQSMYGDVHSLLIFRHGYVTFERYFRGYTKKSLHPVYSVTKSITSALVGIALNSGLIVTIDTSMLSFFPEYPSPARMDSNKRLITLRHVLTMTAGFQWDELTLPYGDPGNSAIMMARSSDWIKYVLDLPMAERPGTKFRYNSGCSVLLGGTLRNQAAMQAEQYARMYLFTPIGVTQYQWSLGANGLTNTGWGLSLKPRDMAKFGYLFLKRGRWENTQVVSASWVDSSTAFHVSRSTSFSYGYQWWMMQLDSIPNHAPTPNDAYFALGWGEQYIFVVPMFDLIVVTTGGNYYSDPPKSATDFLQTHIIKAIVKK